VQHEVRSVPLQRFRLCEVDTAVTRAIVPLVELWSRAEFYKTPCCVTRWGFVTDPLAVCPRGGSTSGYSLAIPAMRRDSHDHPLVGFRSPTGYCPLVPPHVSRRPAPLLGFVPLQRISVGGVHVASAGSFPFCRLRSVLRVRALSTVYSSTHLATPFDVAALVGFSLQGFPLPNRSASSSPADYPHGVVPSACALSS
jgi:hypothetical protein